MNPNEYQQLAARTECDQSLAMARVAGMHKHPNIKGPIRLMHAAIGLAGDAGEFAACIERWIYYGLELDETNAKEELGDCLWYIALACNALGVNLEDVMAANLAKLKRRYPEKYTDDCAKEENRDRDAERDAVEETVLGEDTRRIEIGNKDEPALVSPKHRNSFMECGSCVAKPGMPQLCNSCLHNRSLITHLKLKVEHAKSAD